MRRADLGGLVDDILLVEDESLMAGMRLADGRNAVDSRGALAPSDAGNSFRPKRRLGYGQPWLIAAALDPASTERSIQVDQICEALQARRHQR